VRDRLHQQLMKA